VAPLAWNFLNTGLPVLRESNNAWNFLNIGLPMLRKQINHGTSSTPACRC
jgi:hypothetical protein